MAPTQDAASPMLTWDLQPLTAIIPEWSAQQDQLLGSTTQRIAWVSQWQRHVNPDCICVVARSASGLELILTLEVVKQGPLTIATFPGGQHANENFVAVSIAFAAINDQDCLARLKAIIKQKRPEIDAVYLNRQVETLHGMTNPMLPIDQSTPTDIALSFVLNPDFQVVLAARDGSKKQKKIRKAARRFDERGGWTYKIMANPDEAKAAMAHFYALKARRFASKGIADVFAPTEVQAFFNSIFLQSIEQGTDEFEVHALKVGEEIVAVTGNTRLGARFNVEFSAVDDTDPGVSHGEFLFFQMIQAACARGVHTFSFGVGDEPYKRSWCNIETAQYNTAVSLTWKGALAARAEGLKTRTKRVIKSNKKLYMMLKKMRKTTKGPTP